MTEGLGDQADDPRQEVTARASWPKRGLRELQPGRGRGGTAPRFRASTSSTTRTCRPYAKVLEDTGSSGNGDGTDFSRPRGVTWKRCNEMERRWPTRPDWNASQARWHGCVPRCRAWSRHGQLPSCAGMFRQTAMNALVDATNMALEAAGFEGDYPEFDVRRDRVPWRVHPCAGDASPTRQKSPVPACPPRR